MTSVGEGAFEYCFDLTSVSIPDSVTDIGEYAFYYCEGLRQITIPVDIAEIGAYMFYDCSSLRRVTLPACITLIGDSAFQYCDSLTDVYYAGTETQWNSISVGADNEDLLNATLHFGSTGAPMGDLDGDREIAVSDASIALSYYAEQAIGGGNDISDEILEVADIDADGTISVGDARYILIYYAETSVGGSPTWEEILAG